MMTEQPGFAFPDFDGETYERKLDIERLSSSLAKVWVLMRDGRERTLAMIAEEVGCSESGASARLRDLRKPRFKKLFPTLKVHSRRADGGLWFYRIDVPYGWRTSPF